MYHRIRPAQKCFFLLVLDDRNPQFHFFWLPAPTIGQNCMCAAGHLPCVVQADKGVVCCCSCRRKKKILFGLEFHQRKRCLLDFLFNEFDKLQKQAIQDSLGLISLQNPVRGCHVPIRDRVHRSQSIHHKSINLLSWVYGHKDWIGLTLREGQANGKFYTEKDPQWRILTIIDISLNSSVTDEVYLPVFIARQTRKWSIVYLHFSKT